jgi:hypothetical protein
VIDRERTVNLLPGVDIPYRIPHPVRGLPIAHRVHDSLRLYSHLSKTRLLKIDLLPRKGCKVFILQLERHDLGEERLPGEI